MQLLEPSKIAQMTVKNRMVMAPLGSHFCLETGYVTQRVKDYYEARAKGGVGLIITEFICVDAPEGKVAPFQMSIDDDKFIPGLGELAQVIKQHGAKVALQLCHAGRHTRSSTTGCQPVGPSPIPFPGFEVPRQLAKAEIARLVKCFASGAARAKRAGFDAVEVHGAHWYLIAQFLSPCSNQHTDRYGGSVENRARFLVEILRAVRSEVGRDFPVWCRINGHEIERENGITIEDAKIIAKLGEEAGADAIHVSGLPAVEIEPGELLPLAAAVKKAVIIPVIAVGRISPALGEDTLQQGKADFIAFGRATIADPEFANKVASGRLDDIRPCIHCFGCLTPTGLTCSVNPTIGREKDTILTKTARSKKVIVIGGGPAGMEAARVAAIRGHKVQLYEKDRELGGQLLLAQVPPLKQDISDLLHYLSRQLEKQGIQVHVGTKATAELIAREAPDAVILATGVSPFIPSIPGVERDNVVQANDVLAGKVKVGDRVAIIGGELVGCEVADFLATAGKKVTVMRRGAQLASKMSNSLRAQLLSRLTTNGVTLLTGIQYKRITADGVVITDKDGKEQTIKADTIVLAAGAKPNAELLPVLKEKGIPVYPIGDCVEPRYIREAMREGYDAGFSL